jgi:ribosomal protein S18 acetylase RimI-like enzyme
MQIATISQLAGADSEMISRRPATMEDTDDIVAFTIAAGDGLPLALWQAMAQAGEDPLALGRQRARRNGGGYSYTRAEMALVGEAIAGGIIDYGLGPEPDPITPETPPLIVPLNELENLVCGSWYVNILAVKPDWQRRGIGRLLLDAAERRARQHGRGLLSIIVADANRPARGLYAAHGFGTMAARRMSKQGWNGPGETWLLLTKTL